MKGELLRDLREILEAADYASNLRRANAGLRAERDYWEQEAIRLGARGTVVRDDARQEIEIRVRVDEMLLTAGHSPRVVREQIITQLVRQLRQNFERFGK